jgi:hypothetical protein
MGNDKREPTQKTQPKGRDAKPLEIPVPKRSAFDTLVKKAANRVDTSRTPSKRDSDIR